MDKFEKRREHEWRRAIARTKAIVDCSPPKLLVTLYHRPQKLTGMASNLRNMFVENKRLLQRINTIYRTRGNIDDRWDNGMVLRPRDDSREQTAKRITFENREFFQRLKEQGSVVPDSKFLQKDWQRISHIMKLMAKHPIWYQLQQGDEIIVPGATKTPTIPLGTKRPRCYFDISTDDHHLGRVIMEMYYDYVPKTVRNFMAICAGLRGLSYVNCPFHRIVPGLFCMGGDITKFNGLGGTSVYGDTFPDENFKLQHACPGAISMANTGPHTNNSQFIITFSKLYGLNGKNVVFGKVVQGLQVVLMIQEFGSPIGKALKHVFISDCGLCY